MRQRMKGEERRREKKEGWEKQGNMVTCSQLGNQSEGYMKVFSIILATYL